MAEQLKVGDIVEYSTVMLGDHGRITKIEGNYCWVEWSRSASQGAVKEWLPNLRRVAKSDKFR